ncbi:hypothetical protein ACFL3I_13645 [Pseudomonadota bacterium]
MLKLKPVVKEERLLLGDYVTVHVSGIEEIRSQVDTTYDIGFRRKIFLKRLERARPELKDIKQKTETLINVGYRHRELLKNSCLRRKAG